MADAILYVLVPVFTPLIAISLGDILMGAVYEEGVHVIQRDYWKTRIAFRLLASVPQAIGALFVKDLGVM